MPPKPVKSTSVKPKLSPVEQWRTTLTEKERQLHDLAAVMLKKTLSTNEPDIDNGSYFADHCHAFKAWVKAQPTSK